MFGCHTFVFDCDVKTETRSRRFVSLFVAKTEVVRAQPRVATKAKLNPVGFDEELFGALGSADYGLNQRDAEAAFL